MSEKRRFGRSKSLVFVGLGCIDVKLVVESVVGMNLLFLWLCVFSMTVVVGMD